MTSTINEAANAAPVTECANAVNGSKRSKKHLKALSEADKKPATPPSLPANNNKKALNIAPANASAVSDAINTEPEHPRQTKASVVEALLTRQGGASLETLCEATGWQTHTCRAFLTGLRKKGREVLRASDKDGRSIYLIAPDPSPAPSPANASAKAESN